MRGIEYFIGKVDSELSPRELAVLVAIKVGIPRNKLSSKLYLRKDAIEETLENLEYKGYILL